MSKLSCKCGGAIVDQSDHLSYKGRIFRDQHADMIDKVASNIASYLEAKLSHNEQNWVRSHFGLEYEELGEDDSDIIHVLITSLFAPGVALDIYQCQRCQRIFIENRHKINHFFPFAPETEDSIDILKVGES